MERTGQRIEDQKTGSEDVKSVAKSGGKEDTRQQERKRRKGMNKENIE